MKDGSRSVFRLAIFCALLTASCFVSGTLFAQTPSRAGRGSRILLKSGWMLGSSCSIQATGEQVSAAGFSTAGWHETTVPSTVVAALVADKTYPDPYFADNLRRIPGAAYPIGENFSHMAIPEDSPFHCSWWYRKSFKARASANERVWLRFDGINNRANVWLNGQRIADAKEVAGAYRTYEFDVTPYLSRDQENVLAVETFAQSEKDLGINWVDWNPAPPDKDMGLWRGVSIQSTGPVSIRYPQVITHFPDDSLSRANLTVEAELHNGSDKPVDGTLEVSLEGLPLRQDISLNPGEARVVRFTPEQFPKLHLSKPQVWWPRQMGAPNLRTLALRFSTRGEISDSATIRYGIREIRSELDAQNHLVFLVNGKRILIRGGGWAPDMLLREDANRLKTEFRYVRDLNLNTIRLEGKLETDEFYNLADAQGVLIMAGWCCCDIWEEWDKWQPGDREIATASLRSQILRMRSHPSMLVWLNGSDNPPPAPVEQAYIQVLKDSDWPNPYISSATQKPTSVTGPSGVKMTGPYDYIPPDYWRVEAGNHGGAWGFNTETGPGPAVPPVACVRMMLGAAEIKPGTMLWNYHAGSGDFKDLSHFESAMSAIYGAPGNLHDYQLKAQAMAYDGERAMFEAYSGRKYKATGIIQWMLNNAWPSLIWHLYDYYLQPAGGYFGAKKALELVHVQYAYDDRSVEVVNSAYEPARGLRLTAEVYDAGLHQRFSHQATVDVEADAVAKPFALPDDAFNDSSPIHFVRLELRDHKGGMVSTNFYWLSAKKNTYNWGETTYRFTPVTSWEDLTALQSLPSARVVAESVNIEEHPQGATVRVRLKNPTSQLAFQIHLGIQPLEEEMEILPVLWSDNYVELMPGESRELTAQFLSAGALKKGARLQISGWNVAPSTKTLAKAGTASTDAPDSRMSAPGFAIE